MTTETELNLYFAMLAHNKQLKRREGIEKVHTRCQVDVEQVLRGIDDVSPAVAPAVKQTPALLLGLPGIDVLKYIGVRKI